MYERILAVEVAQATVPAARANRSHDAPIAAPVLRAA
jgi:hypothetical protein